MPINPLAGSTDNKEQDELKKSQITGGQSAHISGNVGGQLAMSGGGAASPIVSTAQQPRPTSSGSFTNLGQYVKANLEQAKGLGSKLEENVQKSAATGLSGLSGAQQEYQQKVQEAGVKPEDFSAERVSGIVSGAKSAQEIQDDAQKFGEVRAKEAQWAKGGVVPELTSQESFQTAKSQLGQAAGKAQLTGTEAGRQTLLQEAYKRPDYSKGQQSLDQLLTQTAPENRQRFENLRQNLLGQYGLAGAENQAIENAATQRGQAALGTEQAFQNINTTLYGQLAPGYKYGSIGQDNLPTVLDANGNEVARDPNTGTYATNIFVTGGTEQQPQYGALTNLYGQLQTAPQTAQTALSQDYQKKAEALTNYLRQTYGEKPFGADINAVVQSVLGGAPATEIGAPGTATVQSTMTPEQLARVQALNALAGRDQNVVGFGQGATAFNPADVTGQPRFTTTTAQDIAAGGTQLREAQQQTRADVVNMAQPNNIGFKDLYGGAHSGQEAINMVLSRVTGGMKNPKYDIQETSKVSGALRKQLDEINNKLTAAGQAPVQITSDVLNNAKIDAIKNMMTRGSSPALQGGTGWWGTNPSKEFVQKYENRINWHAQQGRPEYKQAMEELANVLALSRTVNGVRENPERFFKAINPLPTF